MNGDTILGAMARERIPRPQEIPGMCGRCGVTPCATGDILRLALRSGGGTLASFTLCPHCQVEIVTDCVRFYQEETP